MPRKQPKLPATPTFPPYHSSSRVKDLLSFAASTNFNPRGLESRYYPCYVTAFQELFHPVSDNFHASTQMAISIPGGVVQDTIQETAHKRQGEKLSRERLLIEATPDPVEPSSSQRSSARLIGKFLNHRLEHQTLRATEERIWQEKELARRAKTEDLPNGKHIGPTYLKRP